MKTLDQAVVNLLKDQRTVKVLTTVDERGAPHSVFKGSIFLGTDGFLHYLELLETSRTNRNLVYSLWYDRPVSILLKGEDKVSYQIKGLPVKVHVSGPVFQEHYVEARKRWGDVDLAGVWVIRPDEVINETWATRSREEKISHPTFTHLDRLVIQ